MSPIPVALFDRLIGGEVSPNESVMREITRFFNTRASSQSIAEGDGVPEWRNLYAGDERAVQQFCRQLRDALLRHDPRIQSLTVEAVGVDKQRLALCLVITLREHGYRLIMNIHWQQGGWQSSTPGEINGRSIAG